jgi:hypothetical protein
VTTSSLEAASSKNLELNGSIGKVLPPDLCPELYFHIFSFLDLPTLRDNVQLVCSSWRDLARASYKSPRLLRLLSVIDSVLDSIEAFPRSKTSKLRYKVKNFMRLRGGLLLNRYHLWGKYVVSGEKGVLRILKGFPENEIKLQALLSASKLFEDKLKAIFPPALPLDDIGMEKMEKGAPFIAFEMAIREMSPSLVICVALKQKLSGFFVEKKMFPESVIYQTYVLARVCSEGLLLQQQKNQIEAESPPSIKECLLADIQRDLQDLVHIALSASYEKIFEEAEAHAIHLAEKRAPELITLLEHLFACCLLPEDDEGREKIYQTYPIMQSICISAGRKAAYPQIKSILDSLLDEQKNHLRLFDLAKTLFQIAITAHLLELENFKYIRNLLLTASAFLMGLEDDRPEKAFALEEFSHLLATFYAVAEKKVLSNALQGKIGMCFKLFSLIQEGSGELNVGDVRARYKRHTKLFKNLFVFFDKAKDFHSVEKTLLAFEQFTVKMPDCDEKNSAIEVYYLCLAINRESKKLVVNNSASIFLKKEGWIQALVENIALQQEDLKEGIFNAIVQFWETKKSYEFEAFCMALQENERKMLKKALQSELASVELFTKLKTFTHFNTIASLMLLQRLSGQFGRVDALSDCWMVYNNFKLFFGLAIVQAHLGFLRQMWVWEEHLGDMLTIVHRSLVELKDNRQISTTRKAAVLLLLQQKGFISGCFNETLAYLCHKG